MGELSAKHLRGESMADVIFNGSSARKPVGTASVELVFDNSDGKIGGAYASYPSVAQARRSRGTARSGYFINSAPVPSQGHHPAVSGHRPRPRSTRSSSRA